MSLELSRKHKVVTWSNMRESSRLWQTGVHANLNTFQILKYYAYWIKELWAKLACINYQFAIWPK